MLQQLMKLQISFSKEIGNYSPIFFYRDIFYVTELISKGYFLSNKNLIFLAIL